jgi:hypothetical protein
MAKSVDTKVTLTRIEDGESLESVVKQLSVTVTDLSRNEVTLGISEAEASYLPPGIATIDYLFVFSDQEITMKLNAASAATTFTIPAGGFFVVMKAHADVDDIRFIGGAVAANVLFWVGEA